MARTCNAMPASWIYDALSDQLLAGRPHGPGLLSEEGLSSELK